VFGLITTTIEVLGAISISVGVGFCFGLGAALIAAGVLLLVGSYLATAPDGDN
jgi:hypothetical protein